MLLIIIKVHRQSVKSAGGFIIAQDSRVDYPQDSSWQTSTE